MSPKKSFFYDETSDQSIHYIVIEVKLPEENFKKCEVIKSSAVKNKDSQAVDPIFLLLLTVLSECQNAGVHPNLS